MTEAAGSQEPAQTWKIGALAKLTGLTVRALHHYDHIGLLTPSSRSVAGHRLYTPSDVARLYRIGLLRRLGFSLEQIAQVLDDPQWQLREVVQRHLEDTTRRIDLALSLRPRPVRGIQGLVFQRRCHDSPSPDQLSATLEEMTLLDVTVHSTTALLVYDDLAAAQEYLVRVFGLTAGPLQCDSDGRVAHAEVRRGTRSSGCTRPPRATSRRVRSVRSPASQ